MIEAVKNPEIVDRFPRTVLVFEAPTQTTRLIVTVERAAIDFEPVGTEPENPAEWDAVASAIAVALTPRIDELAKQEDRVLHDGVASMWHELRLDRETLSRCGITLQTMAHWLMRGPAGFGQVDG